MVPNGIEVLGWFGAVGAQDAILVSPDLKPRCCGRDPVRCAAVAVVLALRGAAVVRVAATVIAVERVKKSQVLFG